MLASLLNYDLDNRNVDSAGAVTNAQATQDLNFAHRLVSRAIYQYDPLVTLTVVASQPNYDMRNTTVTAFSRKMIEIKTVMINGNLLRAASGRRFGTYGLSEMDRNYSTWRTDPAGVPQRAFQVGDTLWLHPKPTAAVLSSGQNYVSGQYMCADLDAASDLSNSPDLPEELHEAAVRLAADFAADPSVTEQEGMARLARYASKAGVDIAEIRRRNKRMAEGLGSTPGSGYANYTLA